MPEPDVVAFVRASLGREARRVLEVGAGDGALAAVLREAGHDVVAIDPAGGAAGVEPVALAELDAPDGHFDAAVAVVSLHHVEPLEPSLARLAAAVRPGGALVVDELDVEALDERAARWWLEQRAAVGAESSPGPEELVAEMRRHVHPLARLCEALAPDWRLGEPVRGPYLHRWHLPGDQRDAEIEGIAAGTLPAMGARLVGVRRGA